jgi:superoxide dismutase, Cu-Zn family
MTGAVPTTRGEKIMMGTVRRRAGWRLPLLGAAVVLAGGCAGGSPAEGESGGEAAPAATAAVAAPAPAEAADLAEGVLAPPEQASNAFTYNPALAPQGARVAVDVAGSWPTQIRLEVAGLLPGRGYAAHAHVNACGPTGDAAGPHFQKEVDPAAGPGKPSTDPAYANPQNEIWLDLHTDGAGDAESTATVPFTFTDRAPASVVIHEAEVTGTEPGKAGTAGARLACINVPFR